MQCMTLVSFDYVAYCSCIVTNFHTDTDQFAVVTYEALGLRENAVNTERFILIFLKCIF
jgi:hypothetical protein